MVKFHAVSLVFCTLLLATCQEPQAPSADRTGKLLGMAGEEAASIPDKLNRFTRQLNIADYQLRTQRLADADKMLLLARDTLNASDKKEFDDFHRIAGWTAISQLARRAGDRDLALKSSDLALAALNDVQPAAQRPQYVLSLAAELADLRGKDAAIELVNSGGGWAADIADPLIRRQALTAFAERLLDDDAYENARTMLRHDSDPVWRTDTFLALSNASYSNVLLVGRAVGRNMGGGGGGGGMAGRAAAASNSNGGNFGRDVRYENVFQNNNGGN